MDIRDAASLISAHHAARSAEEFINRFSKMCWLRDEIMAQGRLLFPNHQDLELVIASDKDPDEDAYAALSGRYGDRRMTLARSARKTELGYNGQNEQSAMEDLFLALKKEAHVVIQSELADIDEHSIEDSNGLVDNRSYIFEGLNGNRGARVIEH